MTYPPFHGTYGAPPPAVCWSMPRSSRAGGWACTGLSPAIAYWNETAENPVLAPTIVKCRPSTALARRSSSCGRRRQPHVLRVVMARPTAMGYCRRRARPRAQPVCGPRPDALLRSDGPKNFHPRCIDSATAVTISGSGLSGEGRAAAIYRLARRHDDLDRRRCPLSLVVSGSNPSRMAQARDRAYWSPGFDVAAPGTSLDSRRLCSTVDARSET